MIEPSVVVFKAISLLLFNSSETTNLGKNVIPTPDKAKYLRVEIEFVVKTGFKHTFFLNFSFASKLRIPKLFSCNAIGYSPSCFRVMFFCDAANSCSGEAIA